MNISLSPKYISKIEFIDKLRERFSAEDNEKLKIPQIIVVGDQSSGKSSILEAISGIKLPRGVSMVTKCPIIMQMKNSDINRTTIMYKEKVDENITNTEEEIRKIQTVAFGDKLTKEPITVIAESPYLTTLTIIDLPGIIKTETTDHLANSKEKTVEISKFYMQQENSLIICVLPANQDISTTTTIALAKECNEDRSRIIVVLTKLDKLDDKEITTIPEILSNKKVPIEKGFYGLIVSDDILEASVDERSKLELEKFKKIDFWKSYKERLGLEKFTSVLVKELGCLIDKNLPILRTTITNLIGETNDELSTFSKYNDNKESQYSYIIDCQKEIDHKIETILCKAGEEIVKFPLMKEFLEKKSLLNPVKKNDTFLYFWHETFKSLFEEFNGIYKEFFNLKNSPYINPSVLEERIMRSRVENSSLFISPNIFKDIVDEILDQCRTKSIECVNKCHHFIEFMVDTVLVMNIEDELGSMKSDIQRYGREALEKQKFETDEQLKYLFESEKFYFSQANITVAYEDENNTKPVSQATPAISPISSTRIAGNMISPMVSNVVGICNQDSSKIQKNNSDEKSTQQENSKCSNGMRLKIFLENYVKGLIGRLGDVIPNFIRLSLFVRFKGGLNQLLLSKVFLPDIYPSYFDISDERKDECSKLKETLRKLKESILELNQLESKLNEIN